MATQLIQNRKSRTMRPQSTFTSMEIEACIQTCAVCLNLAQVRPKLHVKFITSCSLML